MQANGTAYGLAAGIFTSDVAGAVRAMREIDAAAFTSTGPRCGVRISCRTADSRKRNRQGRTALGRRRDDGAQDGHLARPAGSKEFDHGQPSGGTVRLTVAQALVTYLSGSIRWRMVIAVG